MITVHHPGSSSTAILLIGDGLIGGAVRRLLKRRGCPVVSVRRTTSESDVDDRLQLDVSGAAGHEALRTELATGQYRACVLVHGPSDVSWCESNEAQACHAHAGAAEAAGGSGLPIVLVSTDNVFSGQSAANRIDTPTLPSNAYGRVKLRAEQRVLASSQGHVARVSLVYGARAEPALRANFAEGCLEAAQAGLTFDAPTDQVFTPVYVDDAAQVVTHLALAPESSPSVVHVAGPQALSRYNFAREAFRIVGADPSLVRPVARASTRWASRPPFSCLEQTTTELVPPLVPRPPSHGLTETWQHLAGRRGGR